MIVIDASVVLEVLVGFGREPMLRTKLAASGELRALSFLDVGVTNVLRREVRPGKLSADRGLEALADLVDLALMTYA